MQILTHQFTHKNVIIISHSIERWIKEEKINIKAIRRLNQTYVNKKHQ